MLIFKRRIVRREPGVRASDPKVHDSDPKGRVSDNRVHFSARCASVLETRSRFLLQEPGT